MMGLPPHIRSQKPRKIIIREWTGRVGRLYPSEEFTVDDPRVDPGKTAMAPAS